MVNRVMFSERTGWNLEPNRLSQTLDRLRRERKPVIDLTLSNPTLCGFDYDSPAILKTLANPAALAYEPDPHGLEVARRAVAAYYAAQGILVPLDSIFLTTGTSEAYAFVFRLLCNPGDEILVPEPSYPLLGFLAGIEDVRLVPYPLVVENGWKVDFRSLAKALTTRSRAVVVIHPNNPTGNYCDSEEAKQLRALCAERDLAILADEVFLDFAHDGSSRATFAGCGEAFTFTMSGLSKIAGLPQMKAAWIVANGPEPARRQAIERLEVIADTFLPMNAPIQLAIAGLLDLRYGFQRQLIRRVRQNLEELDRQLAGHASCTRLTVEGGWYVVLRVESRLSDEEFAVELLSRRGVYIHPGHFYDFSREGYLVASLIAPPADFAGGIERLLSSV